MESKQVSQAERERTEMPRHELRILAGTHAGARTLLSDTDIHLSLGRSTDNDIVLRDSSAHGTIARESDGWTWAAKRGAAPIALPLGTAVRFGEAVFAVDDADAPWPDVDRLVIEPDASEIPTEVVQPMPHDSSP